jgi:hypothetical protein
LYIVGKKWLKYVLSYFIGSRLVTHL